MKGRDMYAELETIEARGKRKKERKKGFSLFGKKESKVTEEPAPPQSQVQPTPATEVREDILEYRVDVDSPEPVEANDLEPVPEEEKTVLQLDMQENAAAPEPVVEETPTEPVPEPQKVVEPPQPENTPEEKGPGLEDSRFYQRDIYGEMEKIETRGKSLKEKRSWGLGKGKSKKTEPKPEPQPTLVEEPEPEPVEEPPPPPEPQPEPAAEPEPVVEPAPPPESTPGETQDEDGQSLESSRFYQRDIYGEMEKIESRGKSLKERRSWGLGKGKSPKTEPKPEPQPEPVLELAPELQPEEVPESKPEPSKETRWQPLTGRKLKKAEDAMTDFKRKLDKAFKSGKFTREQCITMVKDKEIELGLKPPT